MSWTRRRFLFAGIAAPAALAVLGHPRLAAQGLDSFGTATVPCDDSKPTPSAPEENTFKPGSPERAAIAAGVIGQKLILTGTVRGTICGPIKGAVVDFWQADSKGIYDASGFTLRGRQRTDANGAFRLETIVPGAAAGHAPHIAVRVQPVGKPELATQIFLADHPANAKDPRFKPELAMKVSAKTATQISATFSVVLSA